MASSSCSQTAPCMGGSMAQSNTRRAVRRAQGHRRAGHGSADCERRQCNHFGRSQYSSRRLDRSLGLHDSRAALAERFAPGPGLRPNHPHNHAGYNRARGANGHSARAVESILSLRLATDTGHPGRVGMARWQPLLLFDEAFEKSDQEHQYCPNISRVRRKSPAVKSSAGVPLLAFLQPIS